MDRLLKGCASFKANDIKNHKIVNDTKTPGVSNGKKDEPAGRKRKMTSLEVFSTFGAMVSAVGLLMIQMFVYREQMTEWSFFHILEIALVILAALSAIVSAAGKGMGRMQKLWNLGAATAAIGMFVINSFVPSGGLTGPTFLHGLQIFFVSLAAICSIGIAICAVKAAKIKEQKNTIK